MESRENSRTHLESVAGPDPLDRASIAPPPGFSGILASRRSRVGIFLIVVAVAVRGLVLLSLNS
jgi:hypothetical protein